MNVDAEAAELIIDIYREISSLKDLLKSKFYLDFKNFIESGDALSGMMNKTLSDDPSKISENLSKIIDHINNMMPFSTKNDNIRLYNNSEISARLQKILTDLKLLQERIDREAL